MKAGDPMPLDVSRLSPSTYVGEVVMKQETTAFLAAARARGCETQVGIDMLFEQIPAYLEFFGFPVSDACGAARGRARSSTRNATNKNREEPMTAAIVHEPAGGARRRPRRPAAGSDRRSNIMTSSSMRPPPRWCSRKSSSPPAIPTVAIVASLATYGVGYVARPIGAFVLGHWGDTHGRKNVLLLCLFLMGLSTMAVGLLPTYEQVGIWAPILLVVLRLIQGFAVAGEISGASSMILEHAPFGRRGYFASFTLQGVQAGQILAAAVFLPLSYGLSNEAFISWGWRIPFLLSVARADRRLHHPPRGRGDAGLRRRAGARRGAEGAGGRRVDQSLAGHAAGRLHGADERHPGRRDDLRRRLRGAAGLWRRHGQDASICGFRWLATSSPSS